MFQRNFLFEHQILSIFFDNSFLFYARFHWSAVPANFLKTLYALDIQKDAFPETMLLILIWATWTVSYSSEAGRLPP